MPRILLASLTSSFMLLIVQAGLLDKLNTGIIQPVQQDGCPNYDLMGPWGCAYQPECVPGSCPVGHTCCPHTCGDRCVLTVKCDAIDCGGETCDHGFQTDGRGCQTCHCNTESQTTAPICRSLSCLLGNI